MKTFQSILPVFGLIAAAQAWGSGWNNTVVTTTITTDIYTTYCPEATTFTQGTKTYTATKSETLTITDCPCTYVTTHPVLPTSASHSHVVPPPGSATWIPPVCITTTETVKTYTTYCPVPTTVVQGNQTYTVTEPTTLTITNCPCTHVTTVPPPSSAYITSTFSTLTTYCPEPTTITHEGQTYPITTPGTATIPVISVSPVTTPQVVPTVTPEPTLATATPTQPTTTGPVQVTGNAAVKNAAGVGAFAVAGLAILL